MPPVTYIIVLISTLKKTALIVKGAVLYSNSVTNNKDFEY